MKEKLVKRNESTRGEEETDKKLRGNEEKTVRNENTWQEKQTS